jgi:hypothetical protein
MWIKRDYIPEFDSGVTLVLRNLLNIHARFYDPQSFLERVADYNSAMKLKVVAIKNIDKIYPESCPQFAALFIKK